MPKYYISREQWDNLKEGDTIYSVRSGKARKVLPKNPNGSTCISLLSSGARYGRKTTTYCVGDRYNFSLTPIPKLKKNELTILDYIINFLRILNGEKI